MITKFDYRMLVAAGAGCLLLSSCGPQASGPPAAAKKINQGVVTDGVYTNDYFGLQLEIPADWSVQAEEFNEAMIEEGTQILAGDDDNLEAALKASADKTLTLFTAMRYPPGSPVNFNPSIAAVAENVRLMPGIKNGADYLFHAKSLLQQSGLNYQFTKEVFPESRGGFDFHVLEVELAVGETMLKQLYYAALVQDYVLVLITTYADEESQSMISQALDSIQTLSN